MGSTPFKQENIFQGVEIGGNDLGNIINGSSLSWIIRLLEFSFQAEIRHNTEYRSGWIEYFLDEMLMLAAATCSCSEL
jgi:hypothetical protein